MWYAHVALKLLQTRQELERFLNSRQGLINISPQAPTDSRLGSEWFATWKRLQRHSAVEFECPRSSQIGANRVPTGRVLLSQRPAISSVDRWNEKYRFYLVLKLEQILLSCYGFYWAFSFRSLAVATRSARSDRRRRFQDICRSTTCSGGSCRECFSVTSAWNLTR
jgi:hypothetical protein